MIRLDAIEILVVFWFQGKISLENRDLFFVPHQSCLDLKLKPRDF